MTRRQADQLERMRWHGWTYYDESKDSGVVRVMKVDYEDMYTPMFLSIKRNGNVVNGGSCKILKRDWK